MDTPKPTEPNKRSVVLALSGGGVAAVGHIPVLAALDEIGLRPDAVSGTSMGAMIAGCYCAGLSGAEIAEHVRAVASNPTGRAWQFMGTGWSSLVQGDLEAAHVLQTVMPSDLPPTLSDMEIPIYVVATDLMEQKPAIFRTEDTLTALAASAAIPGLFEPVHWDGRYFVDGGVTNNLPVDVLPEADVTIALDTGAFPSRLNMKSTSSLNVLSEALRIMMRTMTTERLKQRENTLLIQPSSRVVGALDLNRLTEALDHANLEKDNIKRQIGEFLEQA